MDKTKHSSRLQPTTDTYFFDKVRFSIALGHDYTLDAYWDVLRSSDARPCHDCSMSIAKGLPKTITIIKSKNYDKAKLSNPGSLPTMHKQATNRNQRNDCCCHCNSLQLGQVTFPTRTSLWSGQAPSPSWTSFFSNLDKSRNGKLLRCTNLDKSRTGKLLLRTNLEPRNGKWPRCGNLDKSATWIIFPT